MTQDFLYFDLIQITMFITKISGQNNIFNIRFGSDNKMSVPIPHAPNDTFTRQSDDTELQKKVEAMAKTFLPKEEDEEKLTESRDQWSANLKEAKASFERSAEAKRRMHLTNEEIFFETAAVLNECFDDFEIPEEYRPQLRLACDTRYGAKDEINKALTHLAYLHANAFEPKEPLKFFDDSDDTIMPMEEFAEVIINKLSGQFRETGVKMYDYITPEVSKNTLIGLVNMYNECSDEKAKTEILQDFAKLINPIAYSEVAGSYNNTNHTIRFNPTKYRNGESIHRTLRHEALHCREAFLCASLSKEQKQKTAQEYLYDEIKYSNSKHTTFIEFDKEIAIPRFTDGARKDLEQFAKNDLFNIDEDFSKSIIAYGKLCCDSKNCVAPESFTNEKTAKKLNNFVAKLQKIVDKNPDFAAKYDAPGEALNDLIKFSASLQYKYNTLTATTIEAFEDIELPALTPEKEQAAIKALKNRISLLERNRSRSLGAGKDNYQKKLSRYMSSAEEVRARLAGSECATMHMMAELEQMQKQPDSDKDYEKFLQIQIEYNKCCIEFQKAAIKAHDIAEELKKAPDNAQLMEEIKEPISKMINTVNLLGRIP